MTFADALKTHPAMVAKCRKALRDLRRLGVPFADAISLDKAIPLIQELMNDEIGKLVLHALVNAPAELKEIETGVEEPPLDPGMEDEMPPVMAEKFGAADAAIADLGKRLAVIEGERATRLAAADAATLATRAADLARAIDRAALKRPEGFNPDAPTSAMCDAANAFLVAALATRNAPPLGGTRTTIKITGADADPTPNLSELL